MFCMEYYGTFTFIMIPIFTYIVCLLAAGSICMGMVSLFLELFFSMLVLDGAGVVIVHQSCDNNNLAV